MDFEDMEAKLAQNDIHAAVFCSPHNPCGRVWERWEIERAMELYRKYNCVVVSDEIWSDLILPGHRHVPTQSVSDDAHRRTVALYAPSKTFNLAGLVGSYHVIYDKSLRDRVASRSSKCHYNNMNVLSMHALVDDGDEVLIPSPDYPLWTACVNLAGGTAVHYLCDEQSEWYPDIDDIRSKITSNTKAIVIINPNNPTGALYPKEVLQQIVDIAREHQLIIFSDEIYDRLVMDGLQHISIASMAPDLFCVTFSGLSKSHMIAGYRIGWMILSGNKRIAKDYIEGLNMLANMRMCSNVPAQSVVQTALGGHQSVNDYIVPGGRVHDQRDLVYDMLNQIPGITAVKPKAAFYIFPKIDVKRFNIHSDEQFALDLLHDKHILISHGGAFNWHRPDHFRVVYLPRMGMLRETMGEISDFFSYYWQS